MPVHRYAVVRNNNEWRVVSRKRMLGHFPDQETARAAASNLAREALAAGHEVELFAQGPGGELLIQPPPDLDRD